MRRWSLFALRVVVGLGFVVHGYAKLARGPAHFAAIVDAMGLPAPHALAWTTTIVELAGGIAMMLGAFVAPVAIALAGVMATAIVGVHLPYGFSSVRLTGVDATGAHFGPVGYELPLLYMVALAAIAFAGAPLLSIDAWRARRRRGAPTIGPYAGAREALRPLFRLADDSDAAIAGYLARGDVLVARSARAAIGHVQMIADGDAWELKSLAVVDARRGAGVGRALVGAGIAHARARGARRIVVSTAAAETQLVHFYQRLGFRLARIERDAFTPAAGYPPDLRVDGIPVRDRVWLDLDGEELPCS